MRPAVPFGSAHCCVASHSTPYTVTMRRSAAHLARPAMLADTFRAAAPSSLPAQLSYGGRLLGGRPSPPRFGRVCEELGPTYPGEPVGGLYPLQYPGVLFLFPLAPGTAAAAGQQPRPSMSSSIAGVEFPVALPTPVARILIHHGTAACLAAARAAAPPTLAASGSYYEPVEALAGQGLLLSASGACLRFGDSPQVGGRAGPGGRGCWSALAVASAVLHGQAWQGLMQAGRLPVPAIAWLSIPAPSTLLPLELRHSSTSSVAPTTSTCMQDVISELGEPSSTHTKPGRPPAAGLAAPGPPGIAGRASGPPDYFFCYAERGIDVLFCGASHRLTKLVLHANAPSHPDFGLYRKCNFRQAGAASGCAAVWLGGLLQRGQGCWWMQGRAMQGKLGTMPWDILSCTACLRLSAAHDPFAATPC